MRPRKKIVVLSANWLKKIGKRDNGFLKIFFIHHSNIINVYSVIYVSVVSTCCIYQQLSVLSWAVPVVKFAGYRI